MSAPLLLYTASPEDAQGAFSSTARLLDALSDCVAYWHRDGRCLYANPAYAKTVKRDTAELLGRHLTEIHGEALLATAEPLLSQALSGQQVSGELHLEGAGHQDVWWQVELFPNRNHAGDIIGYFFFGRDISATKALARAAEMRQEAIRNLVESINLPMACWDREARLVFCNSPYETWTRRPKSELIGATLTTIFGATAWTNAKAGFVRAFGGESTVYERQVVQPSGGLRWHRIHIFPGARDNLPVQTVFTIAFDIDDDIKLRQQLAANEARIRSVVEAIDLPIVRFDTTRRVNYCNGPYARFVERSIEAVIGTSADELFAASGSAARASHFARAFAGESVTYDESITKNEGSRWIRVRLVGDRDSSGIVRSIYAIGYDVDAEVREREKTELARLRLERFTENIPFPLAYLGVDGHYQFVNGALLNRHALVAERVIGRHVRDVRGATIWHALEAGFASALGGEVSDLEAEVALAGGATRWVRTTLAPNRDADGNVVGVFTASFDVDEIKRAQLQLRQLNNELSAHFDRSPVAVVKYDSTGCIVQWSQRTEEMLGTSASEMIGKRFDFDRVHPLDRDAVRAVVRQVGSGEVDTVVNTHRYLHADGSTRWIEWYNSVLKDADGRTASVLSLGVDATAKMDAEQRLKRFGDGIPNPVTYLGLDSRYQYMNTAFEAWTGITPAQMLGKTPIEVRGALLGGMFQGLVTRALSGEDVRMERLATLVNGEERWVRTHFSPDRDETGAIIGCYNVSFDIHDAKLAEQQLQRMADRDSLTDALTRSAFFRELDRRLQRNDARAISLLFVDLDGFKSINDRLGHAEGDQLLRTVASRLRDMLEPSDCLGRLGGDEFVVLSNTTSHRAAQALGERIIALIQSIPIGTEGTNAVISASVGIAIRLLSGTQTSSDELVQAADKAMYEAKRNGGSRVQFAQ